MEYTQGGVGMTVTLPPGLKPSPESGVSPPCGLWYIIVRPSSSET